MNKKAIPKAVKKNTTGAADKILRKFIWVVFFFGFFMYANTLRHTYVIDDNLAFYGNKLVQKGIAGIPEILTKSFYYGSGSGNYGNYRPVVSVFFALEKQFFGKDAYYEQHFIHVLIYAILGVCLFKLLLLLFREKNILVPLLITLLYLAHPIHTEVVANIKSLDELFSLLFGYILPLYFLLKYLDTPYKKYVLFSSLFFLLGLFSKEPSITFAVAIPCTIYFFREEKFKKIIFLTIPLILLSGLYLLVRDIVLEKMPDNMYGILDNVLYAANDLSERYATISVFMLKYLQLLVFPHPLAWDYSYNQMPLTTWTDPKSIFSLLIHLFLIAYAIYGFRKKDIYSFCILFYFITISVSSNIFVLIGGEIGERFLFTPSLAFAIFSALIIMRISKMSLLSANANQIRFNPKLISICTVLFVLYFVKTFSRNKDWRDQYTIVSKGIEVSPKSAKAHVRLASYYSAVVMTETDASVKKDLTSRAMHEYEEAVAIYPKDTSNWYELATLYYQYGDYTKAEMAYKKNIELHPKNVKAYNNIAGLYFFKKEYEAAIPWFKKFVESNPKNKEAVNNLGVVYMDNIKDTVQALPYFLKAIEIDSNYAAPYERVGFIYYKRKVYASAISYYRKAYSLNPNETLQKKIRDIYALMTESEKANK